jgi:hypothetical protein
MQFIRRYTFSQNTGGNLMILTECTEECTSGKKDRPGPLFSCQGGLLPEMRPDIRDPELVCLAAKSHFLIGFGLRPVDTACTRAQSAGIVKRRKSHLQEAALSVVQ